MSAHQLELDLKFHDGGLLEEICDICNLQAAFKSVKRNKGAPGIDGITIEMYETNLEQELGKLRQEVLGWNYKPTAVKRVEIPKPGGKGIRLLGIPIIKDRVLQMAIKRVLEPILDPTFSNSSYGFRPGKNQRQAVEAACKIVQSGKEWVVDIDLSKFFDRINHDRLIHRLGLYIDDKRVLRLIGMTLRSGIATVEGVKSSIEGSVQGSPLSPLLSNVVLDELDRELERRGLEFCRFADDANIFVKTERAANRVMESIKRFIEKTLKLKVNAEKSQVAKSDRVKFLGMTITNGYIAISKAALKKAMERVMELTLRGTHLPIKKAINQINVWFTGWANYFKMTHFPAQILTIEAHVRRRLRARIVRQQKKERYLCKKLVRQGVSKRAAARVAYSNHGTWRLSHTRAVEMAYSNKWFKQQAGQKIFSEQQLSHWFPVTEWVKLA